MKSKSLADFLATSQSLTVLSGAGVSTASGIPDYRDRNGNWKHANPIQYQDFVNKPGFRKRYWTRSYIGWQRFSSARPNAAHYALAELEATGRVDTLITQNVDRLHSAAGSRRVIDLHGDLGKVLCVSCKQTRARAEFQSELQDANPGWHAEVFRYKPDGDADIADDNHHDFVVPNCFVCGGIIKPDIVMFGESVPKKRVDEATNAVNRADALLVVGSSLMLFSGFRFARQASEQQKPIAIVNNGRTRADEIAELKVEGDCADTLLAVVEALST